MRAGVASGAASVVMEPLVEAQATWEESGVEVVVRHFGRWQRWKLGGEEGLRRDGLDMIPEEAAEARRPVVDMEMRVEGVMMVVCWPGCCELEEDIHVSGRQH